MNTRKCDGEKLLAFGDLTWRKEYLSPFQYRCGKSRRAPENRIDRSDAYRTMEEEENVLRLGMSPGMGKITDAGYDQIVCFYARIPGARNVTFSATVRVESFPEDGLTLQEGFGLFLRDTVKRDAETGYPYSNMAAAGAFRGRFNFFGRSGVSAGDFEKVRNFWLRDFGKKADPSLNGQSGSKRCTITVAAENGFIRASVLDEEGRDLLAPGAEETPGRGRFFSEKGGVYRMWAPDDLFRAREPDALYVGFMAARGAEITVEKDSVLVRLNGSKPERLYASPDGKSDGEGTEESPLDLQSAVDRCPAGGEVCLLAGRYLLSEDLTIDRENRGSGSARKKLRAAEKNGAVLDFGQTAHGVLLCGDYWELEGLSVTGGLGIWIRGSHNRIRNCRAYENLETGILIRHPENDSPREEWPSCNLVEDCVSFLNRDPSGRNADGFACKVAAGEGNAFVRCLAYLNTDDGFDLFSKTRKTGPVLLRECVSGLNGYRLLPDGSLTETAGNGNGFKLGGSGLCIAHKAEKCEAAYNKGNGFTSNSNPMMTLIRCVSRFSGNANLDYYYSGPKAKARRRFLACREESDLHPDPLRWLEEIRKEERE